jgi:hypothetical protein
MDKNKCPKSIFEKNFWKLWKKVAVGKDGLSKK